MDIGTRSIAQVLVMFETLIVLCFQASKQRGAMKRAERLTIVSVHLSPSYSTLSL